jgi:hypothetical protein
VQSLVVIEIEVGGDVMPCLGHVLVSLQEHLLVFEAAPEPFDEDVVAEAPAPVHAEGNSVDAQHIDDVITGELAALVGVED